MDCIFCQIINKKVPAQKVLENDLILAFENIHPVHPVHVLIIPKNILIISKQRKKTIKSGWRQCCSPSPK